jgi:capsular exopolysaccharide synthesis family protein
LFIVATVCGAVAGGAWYLTRTPKLYNTSASLQIQPADPSARVVSTTGADMATQADLVRSPIVLASALSASPAHDVPLLQGQADPVEFVKSQLRVSSSGSSGVLHLSLTSDRPADARVLLDAIMAAYVDAANTREHQNAQQAAAVIQSEQEKTRAELSSARDRLNQQLSDRSFLTVTPASQQELTRQRAAIGAALAAAGEEAAQAAKAYEQAVEFFGGETSLRAAATDANAPAISDPELSLIREKLSLLRQLQGLRGPTDAAATQDGNEYTRLSQSYASAVCARSLRVHAAIDQLQAQFDRLAKQAVEMDAKADESDRLRGEIGHLNSVNETLGNRLSDWQPMQGAQLAVSIIEPAQTLGAAVWPRPLPVLGLAAIAGLLVASLMARLWDGLAIRPRDPVDAAMAARAPMLGSLPALPRDLSSPVLRGQSVLLSASAKVNQGWSELLRSLDSVLVTNFDKTILFTAPLESRGKTLLASNIAIAMARTGRRVVLVDAHPGRPAVAEIFGAQESIGLGDVIEGRVGLADALKVTGLSQLEVLPVGKAKGSWPELFDSQRFVEVLRELSEKFDGVLIDTGPASSDECRTLAAFCDVTLLVADTRGSSRRKLRAAADGLRGVGARIAGIVWNRRPARAASPSPAPTPAKDRDASARQSSSRGMVSTVSTHS